MVNLSLFKNLLINFFHYYYYYYYYYYCYYYNYQISELWDCFRMSTARRSSAINIPVVQNLNNTGSDASKMQTELAAILLTWDYHGTAHYL